MFFFFIYQSIDYNKDKESEKLFLTDMPVLIIDTHGQSMIDETINQETDVNGTLLELKQNSKKYKASLNLYLSDPYEVNASKKAHISTDIILNTRGQSSLTFPKKQYTVRFVDENGYGNPKEVLNMPIHDKWVLNGMYGDPSLMRNHLAYAMGRQTMEYAPETRYVEVYLKTDPLQTKEEQYQGIYLLTEKIERDVNRLDLKKNELQYLDTSFIVSRDKVKADDFILQTDWNQLYEQFTFQGEDILNMRTVFSVTYPSKDAITDREAKDIEKIINDFEYSLHSANFRDKKGGYQNHVDIDSFIKYAMINEITKNIDGGEVSTYFYKDLGSKIKAGPIWDFDMSLGNTFDEEINDPYGFMMLDRIWYERFFQDEAFASKYTSIYKNYRQTIWSDKNINYLIDDALLKLKPKVGKNQEKWFKEQSMEDYLNEVESLRGFMIERLNWMDENINLVKRVSQSVTE